MIVWLKNIKNEAINFNNIRVSSDYDIYNFRVVVVYIFRFKFMVWLDSTNDTDLSGNLNILCFFMSISLILKRHKILMNILALILSITFIVISYPVILEEISIVTN